MKTAIAAQVFAPTQAVALVATEGDGKINFAPHGMFGIMSMEPPLLFISVIKEHRTAQNIERTRTFSVNFPNVDLYDAMRTCGRISGNKEDKSNIFPIFRGATGIPYIDPCPVNMGCEVVQVVDTPEMWIYIAKVMETFADESCIQDGIPLPSRLDPILCTVEGRYFHIGEEIL